MVTVIGGDSKQKHALCLLLYIFYATYNFLTSYLWRIYLHYIQMVSATL